MWPKWNVSMLWKSLRRIRSDFERRSLIIKYLIRTWWQGHLNQGQIRQYLFYCKSVLTVKILILTFLDMYYYLIIILGIVKCDAGKYNITSISSYDLNSKWNKYSRRLFPLEKNVTDIVPSEHFLFIICVTVDSLFSIWYQFSLNS